MSGERNHHTSLSALTVGLCPCCAGRIWACRRCAGSGNVGSWRGRAGRVHGSCDGQRLRTALGARAQGVRVGDVRARREPFRLRNAARRSAVRFVGPAAAHAVRRRSGRVPGPPASSRPTPGLPGREHPRAAVACPEIKPPRADSRGDQHNAGDRGPTRDPPPPRRGLALPRGHGARRHLLPGAAGPCGQAAVRSRAMRRFDAGGGRLSASWQHLRREWRQPRAKRGVVMVLGCGWIGAHAIDRTSSWCGSGPVAGAGVAFAAAAVASAGSVRPTMRSTSSTRLATFAAACSPPSCSHGGLPV